MRLRVGSARVSRPARMLKRLKDRGLRICVWINPYIAQRSALFAEGIAGGYLVTQAQRRRLAVGRLAGRHGAGRLHQPARPDRGTRASCAPCSTWAWTASSPTSASGSRPTSSTTTAPTRSGCTTTTPTCTTRRSSTCCASTAARARPSCSRGRPPPASQQFPVHWGGDCSSTFESMAESLRGGLSLAMSGFGFWSHDIGGFEGLPDAGRVQALDPVRPALVAQPAARQPDLPGAVALRRRGRRRAAHVHPAQAPPDAVPVRQRGRWRTPRACR